MQCRQIAPRQWYVAAGPAEDTVRISSLLAPGTGIVLLRRMSPHVRRRLERIARARRLTIEDEHTGRAKRVHNMKELRSALLARMPLVLLSPIYPTRSHPEWKPLPRMRAASLARLGGRRLIALGGMNEKRFAKLAPLGFVGWAGVSAFRT
jgi:thiamine-phosphate pyrophosphorylase